jgi:hypothetical protein
MSKTLANQTTFAMSIVHFVADPAFCPDGSGHLTAIYAQAAGCELSTTLLAAGSSFVSRYRNLGRADFSLAEGRLRHSTTAAPVLSAYGTEGKLNDTADRGLLG